MRARTALLVGDDRSQDAVDRGVHRLDDRVVVVESAAVDLHDDLGPRPVQRGPLQLLERVAPHLAVEVTRPRQPLQRGERRLVGRATRPHDEPAESRGARGAGGIGWALRRTVTSALTPAVTLTSSSNSTGRCGSGSGKGQPYDLEASRRQLEPDLAIGVREHRPQLDELRDEGS
jgi:hypothetical protein